ncbi:arsenic resistance N-acetyltransferase ArsN2 [Deinococcus sp. YIM 77859]|uniref:arsenic resistance N-acetyltransferase ArsN2 n=1 Tax=Deinococcus sp. YIM 77859 TaxID=1540221 RepID=UPI000A3DB92A|nr:arsenic resistance N-acetyltransferase ArsN2 [Deinococcus sp. YIM 77859]
MLIRGAAPADLPAILALLSALDLPTADVEDHLGTFLLAEGDELLGLAGLEPHGSVGLLRSVAVTPSAQGQGIAAQLVGEVLHQARSQGLQEIYLLTTTAETYFPRLGFARISHSTAPTALLASREFQDACPQSATLMHLSLQENAMTQTIPGIHDQTSTLALLDALRVQPQLPLEFHLHGELLVGPGYHVTEVKAVTIESMDCGGRADAWRETVIQLKDGNAQEAQAGFMTTRKFLGIYDRVARSVPVRGEAEVRFEYGNSVTPAMQYHVTHVEPQAGRVIVHLRTPGVQCKAADSCGQPATNQAQNAGGCAPESGCCGPTSADLILLG